MDLKPTLRCLTITALFFSLLTSCQKTTTAPGHVPKVYADADRTISLPVDSVVLHGSASDTAGKIVAWLWSEVSGPNVPVIHSEGSPTTTISGLTAGVYIFQLMVLDSSGATGVGQVTITVGSGAITLHTYYEGGHFEVHYMGNSVHDATDRTAPELVAFYWTVDGEPFVARGAFEFNFAGLPAGVPVQSARLSLYSNHNPINGDHVSANSGTSNAFYISRISAPWSVATTTWPTQPGIDPANQVLVPHTNQGFLDVTDVDVTKMVNKMISEGNYGFKIQMQDETAMYNCRVFYSSAAADSTKHPKLVVTY